MVTLAGTKELPRTMSPKLCWVCSFILVFCILSTETSTLDEDFKKAVADLIEIHSELSTQFGKIHQLVKTSREDVNRFYYKRLVGNYSQMKTSFYNKRDKFVLGLLKESTDFNSKDTDQKLAEMAAKHTKADLVAADNKLSEFLKMSGEEEKKLLDLGKAVLGKLEDIDRIDEKLAEIRNKTSASGAEDAEVEKLKKTLYLITRQIQNMQFNEEEKTRSDGNSGIKQIRTRYAGGKSYFSASHTGKSFAAIHDHSNNRHICGMGEFIGVLNGVEFRTRHNDYGLRSPANNDKTFNKVEDLEFPDVPLAVLKKNTIEEQVDEMVEWFKAFKEQDHSKRDYRKYFKPILCYLEGAWTTKEGDAIDEPFDSERHSIDAKGWFDLQEKIRFTSYSGTKDLLENLAWLPTTIMGFDNNNKPSFAQWNYRILCHPLKDDLPTSSLQPILDPHAQKMNLWDDEKFLTQRAIRFDLEGVDINGRWKSKPHTYTLLDSLMEEIPGKDNYGANIDATGFDSDVLSANPNKAGQKLNGAYYHRPYKLTGPDAMGVDTTQRGYSDRLYVAMTTQDKIAGPSYKDNDGNVKKTKVSYAIPMEIIYLTPLAKWNPYNIMYGAAKTTGSGSKGNPFSGSKSNTFFHTPESFFTGTTEADAADTSRNGGVYIKNSAGEVVKTHASGVRIVFPKIAGIEGTIRQRYPIMPIYGEGNTFWKRLNAFEDSLEGYQTHVDKFNSYYFIIGHSHSEIATDHTHVIQISMKEYKDLKDDKTKKTIVTSTKAIGHTHQLQISVNEKNELVIETCDNKPPHNDATVCFDHHPAVMQRDK